ncbi:MAG TPA: type VI secretion system membrane subunit TssM, partial [Pseudomonadales bacterium]|nr:type VI secretion system membrane subunit TssM [Pseudomonadales bacterium]
MMFQRLGSRAYPLWPILGLSGLLLVTWFLSGWIYVGNPAAPLSDLARINILLLICLLFGLIYMLRSLWQRHATQQLIDPVSDKPSEEILQLKAKFADAIDVLKNAKFETRLGLRNLYELPWYLLIGNPGSGKTSAILNSGLNFPLADRFGRNALNGLGGTRQCDWWFTNEAVFIDTAGRYTSQDSDQVQDRAAWQTFLNLLQRYRKRRPVNGVVVTVSMQEILTATPDQRAQHARVIRARLDELTEQFNMPFPVYIMLTKLDLLAGFDEYFSDLHSDEADQVWGFTLPKNGEVGAAVSLESVNKELNALLTRLNEKLLSRLQSERDPAKRAFIIGFPHQYEIMKPLLADFLSLAFSASRYTRQPQLRGLYFCSAKQEGAPIDRLAAAVAPQFGLRSIHKSMGGKSYFLRQFFQAVLMPESELVGLNTRHEQKIVWTRRAAYAGMGAVSVLLLTVWGSAWFKHQQFINEMQQRLGHIQAATQALPANPTLEDAAKVMAGLKQVVELSEQEQHSFLGRLGMRDSGIAEAAQSVYRQQLANLYFSALGNSVKNQISGAKQDVLYENLRAYLMLVMPAHRDVKTLHAWLQRYCAQDEEYARLNQMLLDELLTQNPSLALQNPDQIVIKQARAALLAQPLPQRIYQQLRAEYANDLIDLRAESNLDFSLTFRSAGRTNPYLISKMFTKAGYQQINVCDAIEKVKKDRWMWGDAAAFSDENLAKTEEQVKQLYLADYAEHWRIFLDSLDLPRPSTLADTVALM